MNDKKIILDRLEKHLTDITIRHLGIKGNIGGFNYNETTNSQISAGHLRMKELRRNDLRSIAGSTIINSLVTSTIGYGALFVHPLVKKIKGIDSKICEVINRDT